MVGFIIVVGLLTFFQVVDYREKRETGEDTKGVVINLCLLVILTIAYFSGSLTS